jgi:Uma2 family endonuclease
MAFAARIVDEQGLPANDAPLRRLSVPEYQSLTSMGFFAAGAQVELLDGYMVEKPPKRPAHVTAKRRLAAWLARNTPAGCLAIIEDPITLERSEPEPDGAIVRGALSDFAGRHPEAHEVVAVFEVADSTLERDRQWKVREWKAKVYAEAGIGVYVLINLNGGIVRSSGK